jgi:hypothetical protein
VRKKIATSLKIAVMLFAAVGLLLNFISANADGYSHWAKRLLYFTTLSNVWIALSLLLILLIPYVKAWNGSTRVKNILYIIRFVFVISITLTGFIFCFVLAPGAKNDNYNAWTVGSIFVHVLVPLCSISDFFVDPERVSVKRSHVFLTLVPPALYLAFASVLGACGVDFGRGDTFPYFFMNYNSPAGFFGTSDVMPYKIGSFYWIVFMLVVIISLAALYKRLYNGKKGKS